MLARRERGGMGPGIGAGGRLRPGGRGRAQGVEPCWWVPGGPGPGAWTSYAQLWLLKMCLFKAVGKFAWEATKLTAKATAVTAGVAYKGAKATAGVIYDHREDIGSAAAATAKVAGKAALVTTQAAYSATAYTAKTIYDHRDEIAGATVGVVKGTAGVVRDASGHLVRHESINAEVRTVETQSRRYRELSNRIKNRLRVSNRRKTVLLDTLLVGGETLAAYVNSGRIPEEIERAYALAYPNVAASRSFAGQVERLDGQELIGFASGVKGKMFEMQYVDYLNDGHLPTGFRAELAHSATNPGWDIAIIGPDGVLRDTIQAKATDSVSYVADALETNAHIDVVTTSEVHSHLVMQGFAENVIDSGISEDALSAAVEGAMDGSTVSMDWMPCAVSLALIAFSAYSQEGLSAYQKNRQFSERSTKTYLAYLAGGGLAVVTNTWWIGVLGGMGSRLLLGAGRQKRERLTQLRQLVQSNEVVLRRMERGLA